MFKRSGGNTGTPAPAGEQAGKAGDPLAVGAEQPQGGAAPVGSDETIAAVRRTKLGSIALLGIIIGVSVILVFAMRKLGVSQKLDLPDIKIDYPIEQADLSVIKKDHEKLIRQLNRTGEVVQVPLEQVQMNPFALPVEATAANNEPVKPGTSPEDLAAKARSAHEKEIQSKLASLKINSILSSGRVPVANISGQVVRVGDLIGELFIVGKIQGRSVTLVSDGKEYELSLGE